MRRLKKTISYIRQKPQHVRERILMLTMAVIAPALFTVWFATFHFKSNVSNSAISDLTSNISDSFNNPVYNTELVFPSVTTPASAGTALTPQTTSDTDASIDAVGTADDSASSDTSAETADTP